MATKQSSVYQMENEEFFQINDQVLTVLPSDIAAFSDNAVYEETFVRSKAVFAFRSKYSRGKVIITLPISLNSFAEYDSGSKASQTEGIKVLNQLSNFPYCFIKSPRIRSYISSRAKLSSTGFMMFAVDEINTVHDLRVPDVLFAEIHLVFCDHTSQMKDFKFYHNNSSAVDNPADSGLFGNAFSFNYSDVIQDTVSMIKTVVASKDDSSAYVSDGGPLGAVVVMAPNVLNENEIYEDSYEADLARIKASGMYKEVIVSAPDGQDSFTAQFFKDSNTQTEEGVDTDRKDAKQHFHIYWTAFHDFSFGGVSSVKSIKISRKNKLAQQFIGSHKYPFVQYMGRYPARVDISLDFVTGDVYKTGQSSVVSAVQQINNVLDYNNEFYPEISAYNVLKMQSVSSILMGVESIVPNQTFISASSDHQGVEVVTVNFVEADVDEFMKIGEKFEGRPSQFFDTLTDVETTTTIAYLKAILANAEIRSQIEGSADRKLHGEVMNSLNTALEGLKKELFGTLEEDRVINEYLSSEKSQTGNDIAKSIISADTSTAWPNTNTIFPNPKYDANRVSSLISALERRQKLIETVNNNRTVSEDKDKASSGIKYTVKNEKGENVALDASETYSRQGAADTGIRKAYQLIVSLKAKGDLLASSVLTNSDNNNNYLLNRVHSYAGYNIKDIPFANLVDPTIDPFFFLKTTPYFTPQQFLSVHGSIAGEINSAADKIITAQLETEDSSTFGKSGYFGIFSESGVSVEEMYIVEQSDDTTVRNAAGTPVDMSSYGAGNANGYAGMSSKNSTAYDAIILEKAKAHGVDAGWIKAIIHQESHFNPNARSPVGAMGLMQMMPATAQRWGVTDRTNPTENIEGGTKYFAWLLKRFKGNTSLALAGYNAGEGNVDKYNGIPPFKETQGYVKKVTNYYNTLYKAGLDSNPKSASYKPNSVNSATALNSTTAAASGNANQGFDPSKYQKATLDASKGDYAIVDGDTFHVVAEDGKKYYLRTRYYDTPETSHTATDQATSGNFKVSYTTSGQLYGDLSRERLSDALRAEGNVFYIEKKLEPDPSYPKRHLASIYLPSSNENLASFMVKNGYGSMYSQDTAGGSAILNTIKKLQNSAKSSGKGMWANEYKDPLSTAEYKKRANELKAAIAAASSESAVIAAMKKYQVVLKSGSTYKIGDKEFDSKTHKQLGTTNKQSSSTTTQSAAEYKNNLGTTNKDIHVQGAAATDVTSQWGLRDLKKGFHGGIDSTGKKRHEIIAAADGLVTHTTMRGGGKVIVMNHGNGFYTKYLHLSKYIVANNTKVKAGTVIGTMGDTDTEQGTSKGSVPVHLHQETWIQPYGKSNMYNVNPWKTTSLKLLTNIDPLTVNKNIEKFIDKTHLTSVNPYKQGESVLSNARARELVWQGNGKGESGANNPLGLLAGLSFAPQHINNDGSIGQAFLAKPASQTASRNMPPKASVFYEEGATTMQADNVCYYQQYGANISFPAIKIYVVVGNEAEDAKVMKEMMPNYYFEIEGIKDLALVCNNDDNPVDFLSFRIANASFIRTDNYAVAGKFLARDLTHVGTSEEISFITERVKLKPGTQLHIRAGYGNNPNNLKTIFNGVVTELGNEDGICLDVVAEGYGRELLLDAISPHKPTTPGGTFTNNSTPLVISTALGEREGIGHFGNKVNFWSTIGAFITYVGPGDIKAHDYSDPETKRLTTLYADTSFRPGNYRQRLFTNIYAAEIESLHQNYNSTWWNRIGNLFSLTEQSGYYYVMHGQTPWSVLKEMEYRHPGTLMKPLFYQDRMTMFFGIKEQMYIARDLDSSFMAKIQAYDDTTLNDEYIKNRALRFDTVCNFHVISSELNMIQNNMSINAQYFTGANVVYFEDLEDIVEKSENDDMKEFKMKVDDNLAQWEHRYQTVEMPGIHGKYSAFMYGTTALRKESEKMYGGNIVLVGNPCIKAGDYAYISDNLRRINGLVKIRECRHYFDESRGYVTEVTPGLFVEAASFIYSALFLKLAFTARTVIANATLSAQIVANDSADFQQYLEYFQTIQSFVKKDRGFGLGDSMNWFKTAWDETAGVPVLGAAMTGLSAAGILRVTTNIKTASMAKLASKGIWNTQDTKSLATAFKDLKSMSLRSSTAGSLLSKSAGYIGKLKDAGIFSKAKNLLGAFTTASGAAAWWTTTRSLKAISAIASVGLLSNPIGWLIRIAGQVALAFVFAKVQEAELTRQPLTVFPLLCNGRPYTAGMTGYNYNTYLESLKQNFNKNWEKVSKAGAVMQATSNNSLVKATGAFLADYDVSTTFDLGESYNKSRLEKLKSLTYKGTVIKNESQ